MHACRHCAQVRAWCAVHTGAYGLHAIADSAHHVGNRVSMVAVMGIVMVLVPVLIAVSMIFGARRVMLRAGCACGTIVVVACGNGDEHDGLVLVACRHGGVHWWFGAVIV